MKTASSTARVTTTTVDDPAELELADGTRLVPQAEAKPARLEGDEDHAFSLADALREEAQPFGGYRRIKARSQRAGERTPAKDAGGDEAIRP